MENVVHAFAADVPLKVNGWAVEGVQAGVPLQCIGEARLVARGDGHGAGTVRMSIGTRGLGKLRHGGDNWGQGFRLAAEEYFS